MRQEWKECLHAFLVSAERRSVATCTSYGIMLRRFFAQHDDPEKVTRRDIEEFMQTRFPDPHRTAPQSKMSISTQNARVACISSLYNFASDYVPAGQTEALWQGRNPASGIVRGKAERAPRGLTLEQLNRLFAVIPTDTVMGLRDKAILIFYLYSARRRAEIATLRYGDIEDVTFPDGRQGFRYTFRGKGKRETLDSQELPLPAMEAISFYLIYSDRLETIKPQDPLFLAIGREGGRGGGNVRIGEERSVTDTSIAKRIAHYAKVAGLKEQGLQVSLHTLRHTSARLRYEAGVDIRSIQHLLRHSNLATTDRYLSTLVGAEDKGADLLIGKLAGFL